MAGLGEEVEVVYDREHWSIFKELRTETARMIKPLTRMHIEPLAYGSIARGDVHHNSDIDIFIPNPPSPTLIETALLREKFTLIKRVIVQATPNFAVKGYIYLDDVRSYSFPLVKLRSNEIEFYSFAGSIRSQQVSSNTRVSGVNKKLKFIEPTIGGHIESSIKGREGVIARKLMVNVRIVRERIRTLERREKVGRTGVFIERVLMPDENFGQAMEKLRIEKPTIRRRIRK